MYNYDLKTDKLSYCTLDNPVLISKEKWNEVNSIKLLEKHYSQVYMTESGDIYITNIPKKVNDSLRNFWTLSILFAEKNKDKEVKLQDLIKICSGQHKSTDMKINTSEFYLKVTGKKLSLMDVGEVTAIYKFPSSEMIMITKKSEPRDIYLMNGGM